MFPQSFRTFSLIDDMTGLNYQFPPAVQAGFCFKQEGPGCSSCSWSRPHILQLDPEEEKRWVLL